MTTLSYHHTSRLTNLAAERLGQMLVGHRPGGLSHAVFLSSGSEANESAIKLARQFYVERGEPERVHIISRNNSYHGNSIGCVSLTGIPVSGIPLGNADLQSRRRHFEPILMQHTSRVSPCYPYRYKYDDESDEDYSQRLGDELENEIRRVGEGKVAAFFAETGRSSITMLPKLTNSRWGSSRKLDSCTWLLQSHQEGLRQVRCSARTR
jgi:adenosylmethionine-8-amino-7-oxononanoate aminotransferase